MNFVDWIKHAEKLNAPIGDLARDIAADPNFPKSNSFKTINEYLSLQASDAALETFNDAWQEYLKQQ